MQILKPEVPLAETGPNKIYPLTDHIAAFLPKLTDSEEQALDLRERYEAQLNGYTSFTSFENYCGQCSHFGSCVTGTGLCTECWIDDCIVTETPYAEIERIVLDHFAGEVIIKDNIDDYIEKYVDFTRETARKANTQFRETWAALKTAA